MLKNYFFLFLFLKAFIANNYLSAEPFVVLQYNNSSEMSDRSNEFAQDPDYSQQTQDFTWREFKLDNRKILRW